MILLMQALLPLLNVRRGQRELNLLLEMLLHKLKKGLQQRLSILLVIQLKPMLQ